jgi:hypothetical protein
MKRLAGLLLILMLVCSLSPALAQTAECPAGGFSVWMPDHFEEVQPDPLSDPDQCFYWHGKKLAVLGYVTFQGQVSLTDLPQVLTGSETESGYVSFNGMDMLYVRSEEFGNVRITYTWMSGEYSVTLEFIYSAEEASVQKTVDQIINSITFGIGL